MWIGTKQNGLMSLCLDKKNRQIKDYIHYDYFSRDRINAIIPYRDNQLFIASHNGLSIFNASDQVTLKDKIIDQEIVYSIIEDKSNKCWWIGTSNNLLKMEVSNDSLQVLPHSLHTHCRKGPSSHCCSMITRIYGSLSVRRYSAT